MIRLLASVKDADEADLALRGGADIVEYNPRNDVRDLTARVAAKLLKELVAVAWRNAR